MLSLSLLDAQTVLAEEPHLSHDVVGGLVVPSHGFVAAGRAHPRADGRGKAARRAGDRRQSSAPHCVRERAMSSSKPIADHSPDRPSSWRQGAGPGDIEIAGLPARAPVRPIRGQLLRLSWNGPMLRRVVWSDRCYLVPWDDGTLLVGATVEDAGFDERTTVAGVRDLLDAACEIAPGAWTAGLHRRARRPASGKQRPAADHRGVAGVSESDVRDGSLSEWHPAGAGDRGNRGRCHARQPYSILRWRRSVHSGLEICNRRV